MNTARWHRWAVPLLLLALCWCAHFSGCRSFGFYEDDHYFAAATMTWTAGDLARWVRDQLVWFPMPQGRPVGFILGAVLPWAGYHAAGVTGMYALAFAVVGGNGVLFYTLLRRCLAPPMPVIAAGVFVLFPADTTRPFLCHGHILFPAVTFTLVAAHLWLSGEPDGAQRLRRGFFAPIAENPRRSRWAPSLTRVASYGMVAVALLTYETAVLPVLFLPLLRRGRWDRRWLLTFAVHLAVIAAMAGGLFAVRRARGESRAVDAAATPAVIAAQVADGTAIGNRTAWGLCARRAKQGAYDVHDRRPWLAVLVPVIAVAVGGTVLKDRTDAAALAGDVRRAAAFAAAASAVAYVFCFAPPHFPPAFTEGRLTSTHLAATMPLSIAIAAMVTVPILVATTWGLPRWLPTSAVAIAAGLYLTTLTAFARDEQDGYAAVWHARQRFWSDVLDLCPDIGDRTLVVVDGKVEPPAYVMGVTSWSDYLVLAQCYQFPAGRFRRDPMLFVYPDGWTAGLRRDGHCVTWPDGPVGLRGPDDALDDGNVILLHATPDGRLTRATGSVDVAGRPLHLRPVPAATVPPYPRRPLYGLLRTPR